jgi:hypothetical protein
MEAGSDKGDGKAYWRKWYVALIVFLILQIFIYLFLTNYLQ